MWIDPHCLLCLGALLLLLTYAIMQAEISTVVGAAVTHIFQVLCLPGRGLDCFEGQLPQQRSPTELQNAVLS